MDVGKMWDAMYAGEPYRYGTAPNRFLVEVASARLSTGSRVLVVGDGEGRNGVWLAEQGHRVVTVEPSAEGVRKAGALAASRGVVPELRHGLFPDVVGEEERFDAVVLIYVHVPPGARAALHRSAVERLAPGGWVILEAFRPEQRTLGRTSGGPPDVALMFSPSDLRADFAELEGLTVEEASVTLSEGPGHEGVAEVVRVVGRRTRG